MSKTLYIHIGHYKTGTTALQVFFEEASAYLARQGIEYPRLRYDRSKHSELAFAILLAAGVEKLMYKYRKPVAPGVMWDELYEHVMKSEFPKTLISSEEMIRLGQFDRSREILADMLARRPEGLEIKAIVYLRPPAAHLRSWHNQLIKINQYPVPDFNTALAGDIEEIHFDYRRALEPWIEALGSENVIIRPYRYDPDNRAALHQDFMKLLGVDLPARAVRQVFDANPRIDDRVIDLIRQMQVAEFPQPTINAILRQAEIYLAAQDAVAPREQGNIKQMRESTLEGLDWLAQQEGAADMAERFREDLPVAQARNRIDLGTMVGFVFFELINLRQRINRLDPEDMRIRLDRLEGRVPSETEPEAGTET